MSLVYKPEGFVSWIANRGYNELVEGGNPSSGVIAIQNESGQQKEGWLDLDGKHTKEHKYWLGYTTYKPSPNLDGVLRAVLEPVSTEIFSWADATSGTAKAQN